MMSRPALPTTPCRAVMNAGYPEISQDMLRHDGDIFGLSQIITRYPEMISVHHLTSKSYRETTLGCHPTTSNHLVTTSNHLVTTSNHLVTTARRPLPTSIDLLTTRSCPEATP